MTFSLLLCSSLTQAFESKEHPLVNCMDMDPSSALHDQEMGTNNSLENMLVCSKSQQDRKPRPQPAEQALKCPRCDSINTKFCYYNNYSLTQPRYFCKSCRRYWTKGGTLRNVPVGGGCRKNKRSSSSSSSSASSKRTQDHQPLMTTTNSNPVLSTLQHLSYDCNDLSLAFARLQKQSSGHLGFDHDHDQLSILGNPSNSAHYDIFGNPISINTLATTHSFLDTFRANFHDTQNGNFQNLYYGGFGNNGSMEEVVETAGSGEMMLSYDQDVSGAATPAAMAAITMKQEMCNGGRPEVESNNNRVLWGFPWQLGGDHGNSMGDHLDLGKESWNNGSLAPSWHGLLNSPLM